MRNPFALVLLAGSIAAGSSAVHAQIVSSGPVVNGHHHLNVSDVAAHQRFWVDTLGGKPATFAGRTPVVMFPDALVFMREQAPTGGSIGTTVNHVGFSVPNLRAIVDRLVAAGYTMVTAEQSPPGSEVVDDIRLVPGDGPVTGISYVLGPDEVKVELLEMRAQQAPIVSHHIHFFGDEAEAMRSWYGEIFGAEPQSGGAGFLLASLPGLTLNYTDTPEATAGTSGRAIDHIGFEVEDLKAFLARLESKGITPDVPYREIPAGGIAIAFITDPWGTSIELTQGLDEFP